LFAVGKEHVVKQQTKMTAIYKRLSRDDGGDAESNSIVTQSHMLRRYAKENGLAVYDEYTDDGISGTTFERDDFKRMIRDIEDGKIGTVLCKDLSRLGRNNALVAYYTEIYFPDNDVRFIAVADGIDTFKGENEMMAFKSVVNEYYAREVSRKVRDGYRTKALDGEFTAAFAPYGYLKDPADKHHLIVDEETAVIVKRIFQMAADGFTPFKISSILTKEQILTPRAYLAAKFGKYKKSFHPKYPTDWSNTTVMTILQNREYLGHLVCHKSTTKSFKNRKLVRLSEDDWIIKPNTHEPIVDEYLFEMAQKVVRVRKRENTVGHENIFAGLLKCSDCGGSLSFIKPKTDGHQGSYNCNLYRKKTTKYCTAHYITHKALYQIVLDDIRRNAQIAKQHEDELTEYAKTMLDGRESGKFKRVQKELEKCRKRDDELNTIIKKLFEQNALGVISDERFVAMAEGYEVEQKGLTVRIAELQKQLDERKNDGNNTTKFLETVRKYSEVTELDSHMLNDLIESIVIYNAEGRSRKNRVQKVEINYKFVGVLQTPTQAQAETQAQEPERVTKSKPKTRPAA
jgi:DNA invertase Pin-like site-specific DNA recombinase/ribosomal protein S15P/S13E